jgi:hypothetical protein
MGTVPPPFAAGQDSGVDHARVPRLVAARFAFTQERLLTPAGFAHDATRPGGGQRQLPLRCGAGTRQGGCCRSCHIAALLLNGAAYFDFGVKEALACSTESARTAARQRCQRRGARGPGRRTCARPAP